MAVTEERRHRLYTKFEEVMDTDNAATVMEMLPPVGWADVATKSDLDHLRAVLRKDMEIVETRLRTSLTEATADLKVGFSKDLRTIFITAMTAHAAITTLIVSVAKLF